MLKAYIKKRKKIDKDASYGECIVSPDTSSLNLSESLDISFEEQRSIDNIYSISKEKGTEIANVLKSLQDLMLV
jgi:hypothetical protein